MGSALALALLLLAGASGCTPLGRRSAGPVPGADGNRQDPALSGDGRLLASSVDLGGRTTLLLQEQPSGRLLPLPQLQRLQPHRSPSLSWTGRYLALIGQRGDQPTPVVLDRLNGRLHWLRLPAGLQPERLSLAPDARRLAVAWIRQGRSEVQLLDLSGLLEPDLPPGQPVSGGGLP
ncbi:MAG: Tol biopolymer transporter periplasmic protein [Synechococcaceae cyanobacterium]|nr:Tol biopolymer transporter periplasmic protein [Synechococcaceae cyanobacterium]